MSGASHYVVRVLGALVKVVRSDKDGNAIHQHSGFGPDGQAVFTQSTKLVNLHQGDRLPENMADGEVERLLDGGTVTEKADFDTEVAEARALAQGKTDEKPKRRRGGKKAAASADDGGTGGPAKDPKEMDATELAAFLKSGTGAKKLLDLVGDDKAFAQRMLEAEGLATNGSPRTTLTKGLNKAIAGGDGGGN